MGSVKTKLPPAATVFQNRIYVYFDDDNSERIGVARSLADGSWDTGTTNIGLLSLDGSLKLGFDGLSAEVFDGQVRVAYSSSETRSVRLPPRIRIASSSDGILFDSNIGVSTGEAARKGTGPALATFDGQLHVAFSGRDTERLAVTSTSDMRNFSKTYVLTPDGQAATDDQPGMLSDGIRLIIVYKWNRSRDLYKTWRYSDSHPFGNDWKAIQRTEGESIAGPSLVQTTW